MILSVHLFTNTCSFGGFLSLNTGYINRTYQEYQKSKSFELQVVFIIYKGLIPNTHAYVFLFLYINERLLE